MSCADSFALVPRKSSGQLEVYPWKDGRTITFRARVRAGGQRHRIDFGTNLQGWNEERAAVELERILGQIERGTWQPPLREKYVAPDTPDSEESFHVFASRWWQEKAPTLGENARNDYWWRLQHLLGELHHVPIGKFDARAVDSYRAAKVKEREPLEEAHRVAREKGKRLPSRRPLSNRSINMQLELLAQILDDAVEYGLLGANPARGKRRRLPSTSSPRSFLEPDMVIDLLDVAGEWEAELPEHQRYGRRYLLATLILAGPRINELLDARRGTLDLHAEALVAGKKTAAGIDRHLDLTAFLLGELRAHLAGQPDHIRGLGARAPLFSSWTGKRLNANNIRRRLIKECVDRANERRAAEDRMQLPTSVTPHTFRRTFASLCFFAGRDMRYVMGQLGHDDPRMTLSVYAQTMKRRAVDQALVWQLMRFSDEPDRASFGPGNGPTTKSGLASGSRRPVAAR